MAKAIGSANKVSFGKRKTGRAKKSFNKHTPQPKPYKGQGR
jgi:hypothetical protein